VGNPNSSTLHPPPAAAATGPAVFRRQRTVVEHDIDQLDHVNNVVWLKFIVHLAHAHYEALGFSFERDRRDGGVWVVRRHEVDYQRSAPLGARIAEETWVSELRGARLVRHSRFRASEGAMLVSARSIWAYIDPATMRPKRVPLEVAARYTLLPADR
jgi:acyl-CoA thioester hydrolase